MTVKSCCVERFCYSPHQESDQSLQECLVVKILDLICDASSTVLIPYFFCTPTGDSHLAKYVLDYKEEES